MYPSNYIINACGLKRKFKISFNPFFIGFVYYTTDGNWWYTFEFANTQQQFLYKTDQATSPLVEKAKKVLEENK